MPPKVDVKIWVDPVSKKVMFSSESAHVGVRGQQEVVWHCDVGRAKIHFPGNSPFRDIDKTYHCPHGGSVSTGGVVVEPSKKARHYRYEVQVQVVKPGRTKAGKPQVVTFKKDPEVVVDPEPA